jgi:hypothetical protein
MPYSLVNECESFHGTIYYPEAADISEILILFILVKLHGVLSLKTVISNYICLREVR